MTAPADADPPTRVLTLQGSDMRDIASFYSEINRVFMAGEDWQLGPSLDALNDLLYGGYGALRGWVVAEVVWLEHHVAEQSLGVDATREWLRDKLDQPQRFASAGIADQLVALEDGTGSTYHELVLEVFAEHPNITLTLR